MQFENFDEEEKMLLEQLNIVRQKKEKHLKEEQNKKRFTEILQAINIINTTLDEKNKTLFNLKCDINSLVCEKDVLREEMKKLNIDDCELKFEELLNEINDLPDEEAVIEEPIPELEHIKRDCNVCFESYTDNTKFICHNTNCNNNICSSCFGHIKKPKLCPFCRNNEIYFEGLYYDDEEEEEEEEPEPEPEPEPVIEEHTIYTVRQLGQRQLDELTFYNIGVQIPMRDVEVGDIVHINHYRYALDSGSTVKITRKTDKTLFYEHLRTDNTNFIRHIDCFNYSYDYWFIELNNLLHTNGLKGKIKIKYGNVLKATKNFVIINEFDYGR